MRECLCGLKEASDSPLPLVVPMKSLVVLILTTEKRKGLVNKAHMTAMGSRYTEKIHTEMPILRGALSLLIPRRAGHLLRQAARYRLHKLCSICRFTLEPPRIASQPCSSKQTCQPNIYIYIFWRLILRLSSVAVAEIIRD